MFGRESEGYDIALTLFNPQGRLQQLEYAHRVIDRGLPIVGLIIKEGILLSAAKVLNNKLIDKEKLHKIFVVDDHIAVTFAGMSGDARILIDYLRTQAQSHKLTYDTPIRPYVLAMELSKLLHVYTMYAGIRPFGVVLLIGGIINDTKELLFITPDGTVKAFSAWGAGRGSAEIKESIEKNYREGMNIKEAYKLIKDCMEKSLDKKIEPKDLEFGLIDIESKRAKIISGTDFISKFNIEDLSQE
ncbi:MAG: archaeal proteasome endopeptidase complex subunit alpha [Candidatus Asgardarchaeia archaeon]